MNRHSSDLYNFYEYIWANVSCQTFLCDSIANNNVGHRIINIDCTHTYFIMVEVGNYCLEKIYLNLSFPLIEDTHDVLTHTNTFMY